MSELKADPRFPGVRIHQSAYIDDPVTIGEGARCLDVGCGIAFAHAVGQAAERRPDGFIEKGESGCHLGKVK